jgi:hypothetical protein
MINMVDSLCAFCNETQDKIIIQYNNKLHPRSKKSSPSPLFHSPFEMPPKPEKSSNSTKKSSPSPLFHSPFEMPPKPKKSSNSTKKSSPSPLFHSPFEMPPKPEKSSNSTKKSSKTKSASPILKTCHEIRNNPSIINKRDKLNDVKTRCKQTIDDKGNQCIFSQKGRCKKRS